MGMGSSMELKKGLLIIMMIVALSQQVLLFPLLPPQTVMEMVSQTLKKIQIILILKTSVALLMQA